MHLINSFLTNLMLMVTGTHEDEKGQGLVEYGLIIVFVSLACIVALGLIGTNLSSMFNTVAGKVKAP